MTKVTITAKHKHGKASEQYVDVTFEYEDGSFWSGWIPTVYRRTGVQLSSDEEIFEYLKSIAHHCHGSAKQSWQEEQVAFWISKPKAFVTKKFFDALSEGGWVCTQCGLPANTNPARRYQLLKENGYTFATDQRRFCAQCKTSRTHLQLVLLPRGGTSGYETWSTALRSRIVRLLKAYDAYEGKPGNMSGLLPDHKFPEIRWDLETRRPDLSICTDSEILHDFQLLTNQRNLQKREACLKCSQSDKRQYPFGVKYYYAGDEDWPQGVPVRGKDAERGCIGCGWYDVETWRQSQNNLNKQPEVKVAKERLILNEIRREPRESGY